MADVIRSFSDDAFVWDENKAIANWKKHRVTFDTAINVFYDRDAVILPDIAHSDDEDRQIIIGTVLDA
ncbi:MAG: BrnT family toxin [Synergistaceae bacterium]|nr:BrnT family toxin [Synergistaceae bacterium]